MAKISYVENQKAKAKLKDYMKLYGDKYPEFIRDYISNNFLGEHFEKDVERDIMDQVYAVTGVYDNMPNVYDTFIEEMKQKSDINRNLIEVAAGWYPSLAEKLSLHQTCGSITIYEPKLLIDNHDKFRIMKSSLKDGTIIKDTDMIYALRPHDATETIIKVANKNDIDLFIGLCGCVPYSDFDYFDDLFYSLKDWYNYLEEIIKNTLPSNRNYEIYTIKNLNNPIIRTFRK